MDDGGETRDDQQDEDFMFLANRPGDLGELIWVRLGNCRKDVLIRSFDRALACVVTAFDSGHRRVELT